MSSDDYLAVRSGSHPLPLDENGDGSWRSG